MSCWCYEAWNWEKNQFLPFLTLLEKQERHILLIERIRVRLKNTKRHLSVISLQKILSTHGIVVVSAPGKNIYGATVSGTVFTSIANKVYASSLKYHKPVNQGDVVKGMPISVDGNSNDLVQCYTSLNIPYKMAETASWVNTKTQVDHVEMMRRYIGKKTIPNVKGMTAKDAVYLIENTGMKAKISGYGKVIEQSLAAGVQAYRGGVVELKLK